MNTDRVYAEITEDGKSIEVFFPFSRENVAKVKRVAGSKFHKRTEDAPAFWTIPLDLQAGQQLRGEFGDDLELGSNLKAWGKGAKKKVGKLEQLSKAEDAKLVHLPKKLPELHKYMRDYQRAGTAFAAMSDNPLIADQPGLGKTVQSIAAIFEAGVEKGPKLIIAPKVSLVTVWQRELEKHQDQPVWVAKGGRNKREDILSDFYIDCVLDENDGWLIVNPHMVSYRRVPNPDRDAKSMDPRKSSKWLVDEKGKPVLDPMYQVIGDVEWSAVVIDECHKSAIRNPGTLTAKAMYGLNVKEGGKKIALSGTPMDRPHHLWGTLHWLHPDKFTSKWKWIEQWLETSHNGYGTKVGGIKGHLREEFFRSLNPYILRRTKEEVFAELPPKQRIDMWVDMEGEQEKQYKEFQMLAALKFEEENLPATSILTELLRLKQIAIAKQTITKHVVGGEEVNKLIPTTDSCKLEAVEELLDERGIMDGEGDEKVVIFTQFKEVVKMISRWLDEKKVAHLTLTGETKQDDRSTLQDTFQKDGGPRVLIMTAQAGGTSITLDRADTAIFMDEMWSASDMEQAEDRLHRVSRIHNVTCYYIRTNNSIDARIMEVVKGKADTSKAILDERRFMDLVS